MIFNTELSDKLSFEFIKDNQIKDSISLGTFNDFDKKFPNFIQNLIKRDTLYLKFKLPESNGKRRVKVPIEFENITRLE